MFDDTICCRCCSRTNFVSKFVLRGVGISFIILIVPFYVFATRDENSKSTIDSNFSNVSSSSCDVIEDNKGDVHNRTKRNYRNGRADRFFPSAFGGGFGGGGFAGPGVGAGGGFQSSYGSNVIPGAVVGPVGGINPVSGVTGGFLGGASFGGPFSPIGLNYNPYRVSDCPTTEYNRTGICVTSTYECRSRGGRVVGQCFATPLGGSNLQSGQIQDIGFQSEFGGRRIPVGICCVYQVTCGGTIINNGTYFRNPNSPATYNDARACTASIPRVPPGVCQIRLDFVSFSLKPPTSGECDVDKLIIDGQAQNHVVPPMCGLNNGQHLYLDIDRANNPITLTVLTGVGSLFNRQFDIRVTFIHCASPYKAPSNCLQYFFDLHGEFKSFNFDYYQQTNARYLKNLDYAICFRKLSGFCSITYSMPKYGIPVEQDTQQPQQRPGGKYFNIVNMVPAGVGMGGSGPVKCPDDFLVLGTMRFCGNVLNDDVERGSSPTVSEEITDNGSGPIVARFRTNGDEMVGLGFLLQYRLNHCFFGGRKK